jgi:Anti-sigma factor NepR
MNTPPKPGAGAGRKRNGASDPMDPHGEVGLKLKALYAEVEREPIPPNLLDLLEKLAEAEKRARK